MLVGGAAILAVIWRIGAAEPPLAGGSGSVTVEAVPPLLAINQETVVRGLYPGGPAHTLSGSFTNRGKGPVYVGTVTASLTGVTARRGICALDDFVIDGAVMPVDREIPVGDGVGSWGGATISMLNSSRPQDGCQEATVQIAYAAP